MGPQVPEDPLAGQGLQLRVRLAHKFAMNPRETIAPPGPVVCNQARLARLLLKLRELRFHGELAWGTRLGRVK